MKFDKNEIEMKLLEGMSVPKIAEYYGVSKNTIYRFCKKNNVNYKNSPDITAEEIKELVDSGMLIQDICKMLGCTKAQLSWIYRNNGYNFANHTTQREKHSEFMKDNNPVQGARPQHIIDTMRNGYLESKKREREDKLKNGITYVQYARYARYDAYVKLQGTYDSDISEIDHIFSIKDCWDNCIPLELVSNDGNLQVISRLKNRIKHSNSNVSLDEFLKNVGVQRLSKSQLNWKKVE